MGGDTEPPSAVRIDRLPQLFCANTFTSAIVAEHVVLLDLASGEYLVLDEIATLMWQQFLLKPADRNITAIAKRFSTPLEIVTADMADLAEEQVAAGRLTPVPGPTDPPRPPARYRRPSVARALWERASAANDLRKGFHNAYKDRILPSAAFVEPNRRLPADRVIATFAKAENWYPSRAAPQDCLPRSLALLSVLRTAGWPAEHVIGVAMYPFQAHAWVELFGKPIREGSTFTDGFTVIQRA